MLKIHLFGGVQLTLNDKPVNGLPTRKAEALLVYLAVTGRLHNREQLADLLWDDRPPDQALANLRSILSSLRRKLKPYLDITRQTIGLNHDSDIWIDTNAFQQAINNLTDPDQCQTALDLYQAPFLDGFYLRDARRFEEWATLERERWQRQAITGFVQFVTHCLDNGDYQRGLTYASRWVALDPLSEEAHRQLMWLYARTGQFNAAIQQYDRCCQLLADELDVPPTPATTKLFERIRTARQMPRHNLPPQSTPFIGREAEIAALQTQLIDPTGRLLTLLGPGGMGKTRLAIQTATQLLQNRPVPFLHGLHFIPLAAITTPTDLIPAIAAPLDLTFHGQTPLQTQLLDYLRHKELLLILDNLEQLVEHDATIDLILAILQTAPAVKLFITSRERLNLAEERTFTLDGLPAGSTATTLFLETARRVHHTFQPTATDQTIIHDICHQLDGHPLGIELAAVWVRQFSVSDIAAQINHNLDFLATTWRNVPQRHRSLRAVFEHSWQALTAAEQRVLRQLAVFRGDFSAHAASAITGATIPLLTALVDKSLIHSDGQGQFSLHNLIRQYAVAKLQAMPTERAALNARHSRYYADFLQQQYPRLNSADEPAGLRDIRRQHDNIRMAWHWATAQGHTDQLHAMLSSLVYYYDTLGLYQAGQELFQTVADQYETATEPAGQQLYARLLTRLGRLAQRLGQYEPAGQLLTASLDYWDTQPAGVEHALALTYYGEYLRLQGQSSDALSHQERSLALAQASDDPIATNRAYLHLANAHFLAGNYTQARATYETGLTLCRQLGSPRQIALYLSNLGALTLELGEYTAAHTYLHDSLHLVEKLNHRWGLAALYNNLGVLAYSTGDTPLAEQRYREAIATYRDIGHRYGIAHTLTNLADIRRLNGDHDTARQYATEALNIWRQLDTTIGIGETLAILGHIALAQNQPATAQDYYQQWLTIARANNSPRDTAIALAYLGNAALTSDATVEAQQFFYETFQIAHSAGIAPVMGRAGYGWAQLLHRQGDSTTASHWLHAILAHDGTEGDIRTHATRASQPTAPCDSPRQHNPPQLNRGFAVRFSRKLIVAFCANQFPGKWSQNLNYLRNTIGAKASLSKATTPTPKLARLSPVRRNIDQSLLSTPPSKSHA